MATLTCLAQNSKRDFVISGGRIKTLTDLEAASQIIENTMRSQLGEYQLNLSKGIDYVNNIFANNPNFQRFDSQARTQVLALSFVESIDSLEYNLENDVFTYTLTVKTIYGTTTVNGDSNG